MSQSQTLVFLENLTKSNTAPSSHTVNRVFFCCLMMPKDMLQIALLFIISCMVEEVDGVEVPLATRPTWSTTLEIKLQSYVLENSVLQTEMPKQQVFDRIL